MEKTISVSEAQRQFRDVIKEVYAKGDQYLVQDDDEVVAAVIPMRVYRQLRSDREAFFEQMRVVSERSGLSEAEATDLVEQAIQAVRAVK